MKRLPSNNRCAILCFFVSVDLLLVPPTINTALVCMRAWKHAQRDRNGEGLIDRSIDRLID